MISIVDLIIMMVVVSFCAAAIVGTLVYCILKKKYDEEVGYLKSRLSLFEERSMQLEDMHLDHMVKYH